MRPITAVLALSFALQGLYAYRRQPNGDILLQEREGTGSIGNGNGTQNRACKKQSVCLVTANAADRQEDGFNELFVGCLRENPETTVVVLTLQDFRGQAELPLEIEEASLGLGTQPPRRFKLRDQMMLSDKGTGKNNICYSKYLGGGAAMAAAGFVAGAKVGSVVPIKGTAVGGILGAVGGYLIGTFAQHKLGIGCGGVSVVVYKHGKHDVHFEGMTASHAAGDKALGQKVRTSLTTLKGTVAMKLGINGRKLVVASTHAQEGVRAKERGKPCPSEPTPEDVSGEKKRVEDFRSGLAAIHEIASEEAGILWGGDFNPRTVNPASGCPIFEGDMSQLLEGKDILGAVPEGDGKQLTTFSKELCEFSRKQAVRELVEVQMAQGEVCPTYNKDENHESQSKPQFMCNSPLHGPMYYKFKKPPSWTDRIFTNNADWLSCGNAERIPHKEDHDAVFVTCEVESPECPVQPSLWVPCLPE